MRPRTAKRQARKSAQYRDSVVVFASRSQAFSSLVNNGEVRFHDLAEEHRRVHLATTIDADESVDEIVTALTGGVNAVVVADAGKPIGVVTRSDLLEYLAHAR